MTGDRVRRLRDERGSALIAVVLISGVTTLLTLTALAQATSSVRHSGGRRAWEQAIHLAEAGASRGLSLISADPDYSNHTSFVSEPDEDAVLAAASTLTVEDAREGEIAWVVPEGGDVVYGVGYVPTRADPRATRVMRVTYDVVDGAVTHAVLTAGDLVVTGGASVSGLGGSVHANGGLSINGTAAIATDATATGTFSLGGTATVGGESGGGYATETLPSVDPADYRDLTTRDLCPDATVRTTAATPCTGSIIGSGLLTGWNGWTYSALTGWTMSGASPLDGGYYVYRSSARVTGNTGTIADPWLATIAVEGLQAAGALTNGDLTVSSNAKIRPWSDGVAFVVDRDLTISGASERIEGLVLVGEQISVSGAGEIIGSVVGAGTATSVGSPVSANQLADVQLQAEFGAPTATGGVVANDWSEL